MAKVRGSLVSEVGASAATMTPRRAFFAGSSAQVKAFVRGSRRLLDLLSRTDPEVLKQVLATNQARAALPRHPQAPAGTTDIMLLVEHEKLRVHALALAFAALVAGNTSAAVRLCNAILRFHRLDRDALLLLAKSEQTRGQAAKARALIEKHLLVGHHSAEHWIHREHALQRLEPWLTREVTRNPFLPFALRAREAEQTLGRRLLGGHFDEKEALEAGRALQRLRSRTRQRRRRLPEMVVSSLSRAKSLTSDARFEEAFEVLRLLPLDDFALVAEVLAPLAQAAVATSRYALALAIQAFLAGLDPKSAAPLLAAAEVHWTLHREDDATSLARAALVVEPGAPRARQILARCAGSRDVPDPSPGLRTLAHAAFFTDRGGNFGDISLPTAVRAAVGTAVEVDQWLPVHVHQEFAEEQLELVNRTSGIVVGGGGLLLPDTSPNGSSGWQWNVSADTLKRLVVPLGVVAVGYNLFKGQAFNSRQFQYSLETLVDRSVLFGLRNGGSLKKVQERLPARLADKVTFLPCPTCVLALLHPEHAAVRDASNVVLINAAYDRSSRRFGESYPQFIAQMVSAISTLRERGWSVEFVAHLPADERFVADVAPTLGATLAIHRLYDMELEAAYDVYRRAALVVGMRGHATMIPFGLGTPVLSIVSHPKLRYFLEDIDRTAWAIDVDSPTLGGQLTEKALGILADQAGVRSDIQQLQRGLMRAISAGVGAFASALPTD